jgi:Domain of unknown function (DUF4333)
VQVVETQAPNQFTYSFKPGTVTLSGASVDKALSGASVDKALEQDLHAKGIPNATVNCPSVIPVKPGTTTTCPVSGAHASATVSFQFTDASGSVDESSVKTGA